ncbi:MAG: hypothetical protein DWG76_07280 [Chloroflexi bacterium]|nr:hypothetical protein [Chloroflexota bacterium]
MISVFFEISGFNIYLQIGFTLFFIALNLYLGRKAGRTESVVETIAITTIGLSGWFTIMSGFFGHIIFADQVASGIGWPLNSGFQMELGFASIGIGLVGFLGFWNRAYWFPFIVMKLIFGWGAGLTHILHILQEGNLSPSNTGIVVYWDFLFPVVMLTLFLLHRREQGGQAQPG